MGRLLCPVRARRKRTVEARDGAPRFVFGRAGRFRRLQRGPGRGHHRRPEPSAAAARHRPSHAAGTLEVLAAPRAALRVERRRHPDRKPGRLLRDRSAARRSDPASLDQSDPHRTLDERESRGFVAMGRRSARRPADREYEGRVLGRLALARANNRLQRVDRLARHAQSSPFRARRKRRGTRVRFASPPSADPRGGRRAAARVGGGARRLGGAFRRFRAAAGQREPQTCRRRAARHAGRLRTNRRGDDGAAGRGGRVRRHARRSVEPRVGRLRRPRERRRQRRRDERPRRRGRRSVPFDSVELSVRSGHAGDPHARRNAFEDGRRRRPDRPARRARAAHRSTRRLRPSAALGYDHRLQRYAADRFEWPSSGFAAGTRRWARFQLRHRSDDPRCLGDDAHRRPPRADRAGGRAGRNEGRSGPAGCRRRARFRRVGRRAGGGSGRASASLARFDGAGSGRDARCGRAGARGFPQREPRLESHSRERRRRRPPGSRRVGRKHRTARALRRAAVGSRIGRYRFG